MPKFFFTTWADKKFHKLPLEVQQRLRKKLKSYRDHPDFFDLLEPLVNHKQASHRLRVGNYRIILEIVDKDQLLVLDVGHRKNIYK